MAYGSELVFEQMCMGAGAYSERDTWGVLAGYRRLLLEARAAQVGGDSPTLTVALERSRDGTSWDEKTKLIDTESLTAGQRNTFYGFDGGAAPNGRYARLRVDIGGTSTPKARVKLFARGDDSRERFRPTMIPECTLWLRADLGITLNGSNVSDWADQSGQGNDAAQATAARQPAYNSTDATFLGHASIAFDLTNTEHLDTPAASSLDADPTRGLTVYTILATPTSSADQDFFGKFSSGSSAWLMRIRSNGQARWFVRNGADTALYQVTSSGIDDGAAHVLRGRWVSDVAYLRVDRNAEVSDSSQTGVNTPSNAVGVGARADGTIPATCDVAELIVYQRTLSSSEDAAIMDYFAARYGV